jgi:CheY-like chemotaxis protein
MRNLQPVLMLEDDTVDAMTVKKAAQDLNVANPIVHFFNGEEALEYLQNEANPKPCVILLDLNMPRMNGIEFLKTIKAISVLQCIPVIALTTSRSDSDKSACFDNGIAGYIVKPTNYNGFLEAIKILNLYWSVNELPPDNIKANTPIHTSVP